MANPIAQQVVTVANLAAFQSSNVASYANGGAQLAYLAGTSTELDGGEAFYQRIDGDFSSASNPPTLIVDGAGNRWQKTTSVFTVPVSIPNGGTGQSTAYAAMDALTVQGANIAAAATTNLASATGEFVVVTGSGGPITALGTATAGVKRFVRFTGTPTLTYNATSLILPGAANITVAAGDFAIFESLGSGNWQCAAYTELSGGTPGILPVSEGGTGRATLTNHGVLVGAATTAITQLAVGATGTVLKGATGADPAFGAVDLTTDVTGVLPVANGGTGAATLTGVLIGNGTGAITAVDPLPVINGGTNATSASITAFNNITGYTATGATGTTSTDLVFSTSPTLVTPVLGAASATSLSFSSTSGIIGTTTNDSAAAGSVGQLLSSTVVSGSAVSLTSNNFANMTSVSLTAGDWDVSLVIYFALNAATSITRWVGGISQTSVTLDTTPGAFFDLNVGAVVPGASTQQTGVLPPYRISLASTTTIYAVALAVFTLNTCDAYGIIRARRVR